MLVVRGVEDRLIEGEKDGGGIKSFKFHVLIVVVLEPYPVVVAAVSPHTEHCISGQPPVD